MSLSAAPRIVFPTYIPVYTTMSAVDPLPYGEERNTRLLIIAALKEMREAGDISSQFAKARIQSQNDELERMFNVMTVK